MSLKNLLSAAGIVQQQLRMNWEAWSEVYTGFTTQDELNKRAGNHFNTSLYGMRVRRVSGNHRIHAQSTIGIAGVGGRFRHLVPVPGAACVELKAIGPSSSAGDKRRLCSKQKTINRNGYKKIHGKIRVVLITTSRNNLPGRALVEVHGILKRRRMARASVPSRLRPTVFSARLFLHPEVGDVWVDTKPATSITHLTGVWYPKGKTPDTADNQAPNKSQKVIRTISGHVIQLDDSEGSGKLIITDEQNKNTIIMDKNGIKLAAGDKVNITMDSKGITLNAEAINLGGSSGEGVVVGVSFGNLWDLFINHTHTTAVGPTSTPLPPAQPLSPAVSRKVKAVK